MFLRREWYGGPSGTVVADVVCLHVGSLPRGSGKHRYEFHESAFLLRFKKSRTRILIATFVYGVYDKIICRIY